MLKKSIQSQQQARHSLTSSINEEQNKLKDLNGQLISLTATYDEKQKSLKTLEQNQLQISEFMNNFTSNLRNGIEAK